MRADRGRADKDAVRPRYFRCRRFHDNSRIALESILDPVAWPPTLGGTDSSGFVRFWGLPSFAPPELGQLRVVRASRCAEPSTNQNGQPDGSDHCKNEKHR